MICSYFLDYSFIVVVLQRDITTQILASFYSTVHQRLIKITGNRSPYSRPLLLHPNISGANLINQITQFVDSDSPNCPSWLRLGWSHSPGQVKRELIALDLQTVLDGLSVEKVGSEGQLDNSHAQIYGHSSLMVSVNALASSMLQITVSNGKLGNIMCFGDRVFCVRNVVPQKKLTQCFNFYPIELDILSTLSLQIF